MRRSPYILLFLAALASGVFARRSDGAVSEGAPTVTAAEARLLERALDVSATNYAAACTILIDSTNETCSAALEFTLGNLHFQAGKLEAAVAAYKAALGKAPTFLDAIANLGRVYLVQDDPSRAVALYTEAVQNGTINASTTLLLGHAYLMLERPVSAETAYRQCLLLRSDDVEARLGLAKCLVQQERFKEAISLLRELRALDTDNTEVTGLLTGALLAAGESRRALVAAETAHRLGHGGVSELAVLGDLCLHENLPVEGVRHYREAFAEGTPSIDRVLRAAGGALMLGRPGEATELLDLIEANAKPDDRQEVERLRLKGEIARLEGDASGALRTFDQLLARDPLNGEALLVAGDLYKEMGNSYRAELMYERARHVEGFEATARVRQAVVAVEQSHYADAVELLEAAQAITNQAYVARDLEQVRAFAE